jgi:peptide/nickel transport system ATP-binding protein
MSPLLSVNNLSVDFESGNELVKAVKNVSFEVNRGEIVALVGESGSGKSVTALSILQLLPSPPAIFSGGRILFSESGNEPEDLLKKKSGDLQEIRGNKIAMIFQEPMTSLNPVLSCGYQVMESLITHKKISKKQAKKETIEWFEKVKLPSPQQIFNRYPHELSGGQKQRVMIAMAMCCHPSLLICDEPTTALDVTVQKTILALIRDLQRQENMGVIFITHDLGVVAEVADRALVMYNGEIVEQNPVNQLFSNPVHSYTKALLNCRPATRPVIPVSSEPLLQVKNLSVWFPAKKTFFGKPTEFTKAVDDVSFDVYRGETLGLVGESGCGKTTLGRTILRLIRPKSGSIIFDGMELADKTNEELRPFRKNIQIVFQDPYSSLNPRLTIGSAIAEPIKVHIPGRSTRQRKTNVEEILQKVKLEPGYFNRYPHEFSGGQRQRIVIARALGLNPEFLICDESVSALDVSVQAQVLNLLNDLKKEYGFTIIFISHDLSVVRYISDRIMVMNQGKIEEIGETEQVCRNPSSAYTKKLIASIPKAAFSSGLE